MWKAHGKAPKNYFLGINKQQPCPKPPPSPKPGNQAVYISKHLKGQLGMKSAEKWNKIQIYLRFNQPFPTDC